MKRLNLNIVSWYFSILSISALLFLAFSCDKSSVKPSDALPFNDIESSAFQKTSQDLYQAVSNDDKSHNFVVSPLSIQLALYMVYNGAEGETRDQIGELLLVMDADLETLNIRIEKILDYYTHLLEDGHLDIHNGIFYDKERIELADEFVSRLKTYFDVYEADLDFSSSSAVESINDWVKEKTYDKIEEVLQNISDQEVMFLLNALYLKVDWVNGFGEEATVDRVFTTSEGIEVMIPTMNKTFNVDHVAEEGYQVVRLPLADSALYTYLIMPDQSDKLPMTINSELVNGILDKSLEFQNSRFMFEMPVVETKTHVSLNNALQSLGMTSAFDPQQADLQLMGTASNQLPLYLSRSLHDVYIKMDENGVEGAAVTTIGVGTTSAPPALQFNKPFLYLIVDDELGIPLFIGQFTGVEPEK